MQAAHPLVSYADMERWPDDGRRYELYNGEVFVIPSPLTIHQVILGRLFIALSEFVREHGGTVFLSPLDVVLTEYDVVQPDVLLFVPEREHLVHLRQVLRVPPDLAIEILSKGTVRNDRGCKQWLLAQHGVREYWLVDPDAVSIEVYTLTGSDLVLSHVAKGSDPVQSSLLPELSLRPGDMIPA